MDGVDGIPRDRHAGRAGREPQATEPSRPGDEQTTEHRRGVGNALAVPLSLQALLSLSLSSTACGVTIARFALAQEVDSMHHQHSQPGGTIGKPPSDVTCSVQLDC